MSQNTHTKIQNALAEQFVQSKKIARILALAIESGKNVLLWGPGGHGKSEMTMLALQQLFAEEDLFIQSFGEGMDEATLWGGLDFAALEKEHVLRYFPEQSFLNKPYAVFEELFDAPATVLLALKDTLTSKKLRKGAQSFPMKTEVIIGLTNRDPREIGEIGPAAAALIERFPLQLKVDWPSYDASDYMELFRKVSPRLPGADLNGTMKVLAEVMAKVGEGGEVISPRTAVHALGVVKTAAALRDSGRVERQDLLDLAFLPGMEVFAANLQQELEDAWKRAEAEEKMRRAESAFGELKREFKAAKRAESPIKLLQVAIKFTSFQDQLGELSVTDGLAERRKKLREACGKHAAEAQEEALKTTRLN